MKKNHAQSILELIAMILFIAATILIGGPTIIRGINAHFKIWDDSVQDSYNDPMKQAPPQNLPGDCVCDPPMGGPGLRCGVAPCLPTERLETILCNPVGCGAALGINENTCVNDPTCCDVYLDTALCGTGGASPDCPLGQRVTQRACGGGGAQFGCRVDATASDGNASCVPHCIGAFHPNEAAAVGNPLLPVICPGDDVGITGGPWVQYIGGIGINVNIVGNAVGACSDPQDCQAYCSNCTIQFGAGCIPNMSIPYTVAPALGVGVNGVTVNNRSFITCFPTPIASATSPGAGCGASGIPGTNCTINVF